MTNFDHPNVMKMLGVAITKQKSLYVVMPYMSQGSLLSYLRKRRADLTVENEDMTDLVENIWMIEMHHTLLQVVRHFHYFC